MEVLVERGASKGDCVQKIVEKYGIWFTILREKKIPSSGFLGLFPREKVELEYCLSPQRIPSRQGVLPGGETLLQLSETPLSPFPNRQAAGQTTASTAMSAATPSILPRDDTTLDFVEAKKRVLAAAGRNPEQVFQQVQGQDEKAINQQLILDKLQEIEEKIGAGGKQTMEHPNLVRIAQILRQNDFSERYTTMLMERAHKELSLETLEDFDAVQNRFLIWIGESIKIYHEPEKPERARGSGGHVGGRIMVLIGPTGVGKTTTVVKLAAIYGIENSKRRPLSVRMITIDAFRIGAYEQIGKFGDIMDIPVSYIDNQRDLRREIDLYREETDLILIDTIGSSPKDSVKLGEMKKLLDACGSKAELHLVISASTKTGDIEHILQQFEPFDYQAVLLTKLDETRYIGNVISALVERNKAVSYITDGQDVPKYIRKASVVRFLINLDEFHVDREEIEKRFPAGEADQFQWG
jgi:flagellar biosynthesis protein FlhF